MGHTGTHRAPCSRERCAACPPEGLSTCTHATWPLPHPTRDVAPASPAHTWPLPHLHTWPLPHLHAHEVAPASPCMRCGPCCTCTCDIVPASCATGPSPETQGGGRQGPGSWAAAFLLPPAHLAQPCPGAQTATLPPTTFLPGAHGCPSTRKEMGGPSLPPQPPGHPGSPTLAPVLGTSPRPTVSLVSCVCRPGPADGRHPGVQPCPQEGAGREPRTWAARGSTPGLASAER